MMLANASQGPLLGITFETTRNGATFGVPMQIAILLTLLALLPAVIMAVTPFLRITIVLHFLRQALGTQTTPSNQVLIGLALFLTLIIVSPVVTEIRDKAWTPMQKGELTQAQALEEGARPVKAFLIKYARQKDVKLFL